MSIEATINRLHATYASGHTRPLSWRRSQLAALQQMLKQHRKAFENALASDLGKAGVESWVTEISQVLAEITHARKNLKRWMQPEAATTPLALQPARSEIRHEPLGVVLIIAPWNYPLQLLLSPLIGAIAGGNAVVLKPSELATATEQLLVQLLPKYVDTAAIQIITGGPETVTAAIAAHPNHVFFTGSTKVGAIIAEQCAKLHIPTTLELGGKSPVYVHKDADLRITARRLIWAKFLNAGQTCVAPDYVYVHQKVAAKLEKLLVKELRKAFGKRPERAAQYGRIITERHATRLNDLIADALAEDARLVAGGETNVAQCYIDPTIFADVSDDSALMAEELFGPILPLLPVAGVDQAIAGITARPQPLALYVFARNRRVINRVLDETASGGAVVNAAIVHLSNPHLPFGGVGESGLGAYHGDWSFETFTHSRAVLRKSTRPDTIKLVAAPVGRATEWAIRTLLMPAGSTPRRDLAQARKLNRKSRRTTKQ